MRTWILCVLAVSWPVIASAQPAPLCTSSIPYGSNALAGHYATVDGVKIYYEVYGSGPALLMLHGNGSSIASRICQIEFFARTRRVIAVDSRGHGKSDDGPGPLTFERQADDLIAVLNAERVERLDVVGSSDGGILALELGIRHPTRVGKIVSASPNLRPDVLYNLEFTKRDVAEAGRMLAAGDKTRDWARRKRQLELDVFEPHIALEAVHSIPVPVLLVAGDGDSIPLEHFLEIYRALQFGQLYIRPGAPHGNLGDAFNQAAAKFLDEPFTRPTSVRK